MNQSDLARHPLFVEKPIGKQAQFFKSKADGRWIIAGNRAGKTRAEMRECAWWMTGTHPYRDIPEITHGWCVTLDRDFALSVLLPILLEFLPPSLVGKIEKGDVVRVHMKSGSTLTFRTYGQGWQKFQGAKIHYAAFDEECPEDVYDEVMVRLIDLKGPHWVAMTPLMGKTWVYKRIIEPTHDPREYKVFSWSTTDNPHVDPKRVKKTFGRMAPEIQLARMSGQFVDLTGLIWPEFDEKIHMVEEFDLPQHWKLWVGLDGGVRHPFACVCGATDERGGLVIWRAWKHSGRRASESAKRILDTFREYAPWAIDRMIEDHFKRALRGEELPINEDRPLIRARFVIDPSSQDIRVEFRPFGIFPSNAKRDVLAGIARGRELLNATLEDRPGVTFMKGRCNDLVDELRTYCWAKQKKGSSLGPQKPIEENDDCCDGFRYVAMDHPMPSDAIVEEAAPGSFNWYMQIKAKARTMAGRIGAMDQHRIEERMIRFGRAF